MIKTLENGVRIIYEENKMIRSCTIGIWVVNGSRHEDEKVNGVSHFIEHMMFKGTNTRTAKQIATEVDGIGGQINAFTGKECTCYHIKALDIHLNIAISVLTDMFLNSKFEDKDMDLERTVIEEEIAMYDDQPEDIVIEKLLEALFEESSLGRPILGTTETLKDINSKVMHDFVKQKYVAENIIISICGSYNEEHFKAIEEIFSKIPSGEKNAFEKSNYKKCEIFIEKDIEQNHICIAFDSISIVNKKRYALQLMNGIFGSGMSSRLFQKVREENGLCYSISSFNSGTSDSGALIIYVALSKNTEHKALDLIYEEIIKFLKEGITEEEFLRQREQVKANVLMGLENNTSRMHFLARSLIFQGEILTADEIIERYNNVTIEDIEQLAHEIFDFSKVSICVVGDTSKKENYNKFLGKN